MNKILEVFEFVLEEEDTSLICKLPEPERTLVGARIKHQDYPDLFGFVFEVIYVGGFSGIYPKVEGLKFSEGEIYGRIKVENGWENFSSGKIKSFQLDEIHKLDLPEPKKNKKSKGIWFGFRNVSRRHFGKYYLDIRGGETGGAGRNEHGPQHVHVIKYDGQQDLGKVYFPDPENWLRDGSKLKFEGDQITRKMRKQITDWFNQDDLHNLKLLKNEWQIRNEFNNRKNQG